MKKTKNNNFIWILDEKQREDILDVFGKMHERGGVVSAEIEHLLMIIFNKDIDKVNAILEKWEFEFNE